MLGIKNLLLGLRPPKSLPVPPRSVQRDVSIYLSLDSKWEQVWKRILECLGLGGFLNAFFFLTIGVISQRLAMVREKREEAHLKSAVQRRVVCCVREGWIAPEKESMDSLPIDWIVGAMIYFTGEVSGSNPGWPNCAREKNKRSIWLFHAYSTRGDIAQLVELRSCNWVVAITGWMSNCPGGNDSILYLTEPVANFF